MQVIDTLAKLRFLNNKARPIAGESRIPKCRKNKCGKASRSATAGKGAEPHLGAAEVAKSRGDEEMEEVATAERPQWDASRTKSTCSAVFSALVTSKPSSFPHRNKV